jgi:hypothetical protein
MRFKPTYILTAILALATIYFYQDPEFNGNSRLDAVRAVVEQGKLSIDTYQTQPDWATGDRARYNGHDYTDKAAGSSLFAIPLYYLLYKTAIAFSISLTSSFIKHFLTTLVIGTSFVINGLVMYQIALLISQNPWKSFLAALAVSLGTMLWPYSAVYYGHVPAAMFLCIAFYVLLKMNKMPEKITPNQFFWAGMWLGFAFLTDYTTALAIAGLIAYALYVLRGQSWSSIIRNGVAGALGALIPLSLLFVWNFSIFGNPFTLGYSYYQMSQTRELGNLSGLLSLKPNVSVLYHITFDPQFGLFWQSPVLLLSLIGYFIAFRKNSHRVEALISLYAIVTIILLNASIDVWWGGLAFGARYLIVALPFFVIPLALLPDSLDWTIGFLGIISAAQMLIPLMGQIQILIDWKANQNQFWVENKPFQGFSILWDYGLPLILKPYRNGKLSWTLGYIIRNLPHRLYLSPLILIGAEAFLIWLFYKNTKAESLRPMRNT